MPKITAISPQKRKGRFNVYIDGEFVFGIDEDTLVQESLIVGKEISELEISELEEKSEVGKLYQKALRFLEYRPRSEREVRNYLINKLRRETRSLKAQKKVASVFSVNSVSSVIQEDTEEEQIVDRILKKLKQLNYLNDEEFARWWVGQRRNSRKPRGINLIRSELYQKGVSPNIIKKVLQPGEKPANAENAEECAEDTDVVLAAKAAKTYLNKPKPPISPTPPTHWELKRKLTAYLARRGFDWDTIKTIVDKLKIEG